MENKFEVGKKYKTKHDKMYGLRSALLIIKRTEKTVTYDYAGETRAKIFIDELGNECFTFQGYPFSQTITS